MKTKAPVLVVDDDADILQAVADILAWAGHDVLTAGDGAQALDILSRQRVGVILLDMKMPTMDGWAFAEEYRCQEQERAPIIVLTAARDAAQWAADVHADAYLAKPFDVEQLLGLIEHLTPRNQ